MKLASRRRLTASRSWRALRRGAEHMLCICSLKTCERSARQIWSPAGAFWAEVDGRICFALYKSNIGGIVRANAKFRVQDLEFRIAFTFRTHAATYRWAFQSQEDNCFGVSNTHGEDLWSWHSLGYAQTWRIWTADSQGFSTHASGNRHQRWRHLAGSKRKPIQRALWE